MKSLTLRLLAVGLGAAALSMPSQAAPDSLLARALADPARSADRGADVRRRPAELVALADLKPGQRIFDLIPGDGYWTRIFSRMVGPKGRVYAVWPQAYAREATGNVAQLQQIAKAYGNVTVQVQPGAALTAPDALDALDAVWTSDNFHDYNDKFMGSPGSLAFARSAYRLLKPGDCSSSSTTPRRPAMAFATPKPCTGSSAPKSSAKRLPPASGWPARARRCSIPATR